MKKGNLFILLFLLLIFSSTTISAKQLERRSPFVVFTFERQLKGKESQFFFWAVSVEDLHKQGPILLKPLFLRLYQQSFYKFIPEANTEVLEKGTIPLGSISTVWYGASEAGGASEETIEEGAQGYIAELWKIIKVNKRQVQVVKKHWSRNDIGKGFEDLTRKNETIRIFATPVLGEFLEGCLSDANDEILVYLPASGIIPYDQFWQNEQDVDKLMYADYSLLRFWEYTNPESNSTETIHLSVARSINKQSP